MSIVAHPGETRSTPRPPTIHELKSWPEYYAFVRRKVKTFEVRKADRDFQVSDMVLLREWDNKTQQYSGRWTLHVITYIVGGEHAIPGTAVFGIGEAIRGEYSADL